MSEQNHIKVAQITNAETALLDLVSAVRAAELIAGTNDGDRHLPGLLSVIAYALEEVSDSVSILKAQICHEETMQEFEALKNKQAAEQN